MPKAPRYKYHMGNSVKVKVEPTEFAGWQPKDLSMDKNFQLLRRTPEPVLFDPAKPQGLGVRALREQPEPAFPLSEPQGRPFGIFSMGTGELAEHARPSYDSTSPTRPKRVLLEGLSPPEPAAMSLSLRASRILWKEDGSMYLKRTLMRASSEGDVRRSKPFTPGMPKSSFPSTFYGHGSWAANSNANHQARQRLSMRLSGDVGGDSYAADLPPGAGSYLGSPSAGQQPADHWRRDSRASYCSIESTQSGQRAPKHHQGLRASKDASVESLWDLYSEVPEEEDDWYPGEAPELERELEQGPGPLFAPANEVPADKHPQAFMGGATPSNFKFQMKRPRNLTKARSYNTPSAAAPQAPVRTP